ncbi:MAG: long-chain fatty acid--CoA ligase [Planctomycetota bacterium]|nr:long-chain fatty acid--CoA ligase [Planctomycetota bacterium]
MQERPWHAHYDAEVPRAIDFEEVTIPDFLERSAKRFGDRPAMFFMNKTLSYADMKEAVDRLATGLASLGVKEGTRVAIQMPNMPPTVIAYYAAMELGAEVVLTNPLYTEREIEHQWNDAGCEVALVADFLYDQKLRGLGDRVGIRHYVVAGIADYLGFPLNFLAPFKLRKQDPPLAAKVAETATVHSFKKLIARSGSNPPRVRRSFDEIAVLQYTGGTTGVSKGAVLTHGNLSKNVQQIHHWFQGVDMGHEVCLNALPIFHVFGMTVCMNWSVFTGAAMALVPNPRDFPKLVEAVVKRRVTLFPAVPALFNALNHHPGIESLDVSSVKACFSGSAPLPLDTMQRFEKMTGSIIVEGFGMSETSPVTHVNPLQGKRKEGSVGVPVSDTDARIVDIDDPTKEVALGEEGELVVRGPQVMPGYWNRQDETDKTIIDGWLHTGDLATMDEDGYFYIVGRKKDMINASGFKVFPDEVDEVLASHPKILEAATIGVPDECRTETVKSFVVLHPGQTMDRDEVREFCALELAPYKVPFDVEFLAELPKSSVMKVLRRELRDLEISRRKDAQG